MARPSFDEIALTDVRKVFGRHAALSGVSCTLARGRIALVVGPNGAGKSTLLSILALLSRPTSGRVRFGEWEHDAAEKHLRGRVGLVAHGPMLYDKLSARENLRFFARMYGLPEVEAVVGAWVERVGLRGPVLEQPIAELSRGTAQRLALARALLHSPDLLLLDEPFTGLDRDAVELLRTELGRAVESGRIVVLVTHDYGAVDGLCDHLLVLRAGRVAVDLVEPRLTAARIAERYHGAS